MKVVLCHCACVFYLKIIVHFVWLVGEQIGALFCHNSKTDAKTLISVCQAAPVHRKMEQLDFQKVTCKSTSE